MNNKKNNHFSIALVCLFFLSACDGTIHKRYSLDHGTSLATDARQRTVLNMDYDREKSPEGRIVPKRIICNEPSPDVATVLASGVSAGLSVGHKHSGSAGISTAEGLLQLSERTTAIQALRDYMFQICQMYSNGAINGTTYSLRLSEANDTLVTLLYGEYASGAYGRALGALGTGSSAAASSALTSLSKDVDTIKETTEQIDKTERDIVVKELEVKAETEKLQELEAGSEQYNTQKEIADKKSQELKSLEVNRDTLLKKLKVAAASSAAVSAKVTNIIAGGEISGNKGQNKNIDVLNGMHERFTQRDFYHKIIDACLAEMGNFRSTPESIRKIDLSLKEQKLFISDTKDNHERTPPKTTQCSIDDCKMTALHTWCTRAIAAITIRAATRQHELRLLDKEKIKIQLVNAKTEAVKTCNAIKDNAKARESCFNFIGASM